MTAHRDAGGAFDPLDACRFAYVVEHTAAGTPYAAFRWRTESLPPLNCTVLSYRGAWRLTAHDVGELRGDGGALPLVRSYRDAADGSLACVLAARLRPRLLGAEDTVDLLVHLAASVAFLTGTSSTLPALPVLSTAGTDPVPAALVDQPAPGWATVELAEPGLAWSRLTGRPGLLDRLHDWAAAGMLVPSGGSVAARVTAPTGALGVDHPVAAAVADARDLLEAAARYA